MPWATYLSVFLLALLGGLHCAAMCGGVISAIALNKTIPASGPRRMFILGAYHLGRVFSYGVLGLAAGAASGAALPWRELRALQLGLYALAGGLLLWLGWRLWQGESALPRVERFAALVLAPVRRAFAPLLARSQWWARFALGAIWGLTPCGMVYGALTLALLAGGALAGGLMMLAFGLGTVPNLLLADRLVANAGGGANLRLRRGGALLVMAFGLWALYRVAWMPEGIGGAPFCALP